LQKFYHAALTKQIPGQIGLWDGPLLE